MTQQLSAVPRLIDSFNPSHYDLSVVLNNSEKTFSGTVAINGVASGSDIRLHAKDLTIDSATIDGKAAKHSMHEFDELRLEGAAVGPGKHTVVIGFSGDITDAMHGLYPCYFEVDSKPKNLLATQFESHHAREVFPCVDEPEAKATFDLTLTTETGVDALSNMPIDWQREENGQLVTAFQTTPIMSTYLLAWVVGELHSKTGQTKSGVEVSVFATKVQPATSLGFALDHSIKTIEFFEDYFGVPYPLPKSDQVALPDFSSGAMENWGLVTYRETALLADPDSTTIAAKQRIAEVISHELSHQWFGNLVTMKWWNDLWLNESFATLMAYVAVDAIWPGWNIWLEFASYESVISLRRDAIDGVQAVQVEVNHPDEISSLFDPAIVYAKGARLMRMLQDFIGHDAFRQGLTSYFGEFAYSNTVANDLWRHLGAASGKDISAMMNTWISTSGYPVVHVTEDGLAQEQFFIGPHQPSDKVWPIPLGAESTEDAPAMLEKAQSRFPVSSHERFNVNGSAHYITHYQPKHLTNLLEHLDSIDELGRMQLLHEQTLLARGGVIGSEQLIDILQAFQGETSNAVWDMMALALAELKKFVEFDETAEKKLRQFAGQIAKSQFERLSWDEIKGEPENDTKLRSTVISFMVYSEDASVLTEAKQRFEAGIEAINAELRSLVVGSVVRGADNLDVIEDLLDQYRSTTSAHLKDDIAQGLTSAKQPEHVDLVLQQFTDKQTIRPQDLYSWFAFMIRNRHARTATWQWMIGNWQWIIDSFSGDKSYDNFPRYAASGVSTDEFFVEYQNFFMPKKDIPALTRAIELGIREIEGKLELLQRDGEVVRKRLGQL